MQQDHPLARAAFEVPQKPHSGTCDATANVVGWIDGVSRGRLHGWVFHRPNPSRRLTVEIFPAIGDRLVVLADRYRADLHQSGLCDGYCGFSVPMQRLSKSTSVRIATRAPFFDLGVADLSQCPVAQTSKPATFRCSSYCMQIDRPVGPTHITGWASALPGRNTRRVLRLRSGIDVLAQQRATLYRPEIAVGDCDGYHGFSFPRPFGSNRPLALEDIESGLVVLAVP